MRALFFRTFPSGIVRRALIVLSLLLLPFVSYAAAWDIDQLLHNLAQTRASHAGFVEKKFIAMLDMPVESSGELFYNAPDRLEKRTFKPNPESMILERGGLVIERGNQVYRLQVQDSPELAAFANSIRGTLAGDRKTLERDFQLGLEGTEEHWALLLMPLDKKIQAVVQRIRITGECGELRSVEIIQADGDSSLMSIEKLATP